MQRRQRPVAEAEEAGVEAALVALHALALKVHLALGGDDGLDVVRLGQGAHVHVVVHHQQLVFEVGAAEAVVLHLLYAGHVHAVAEQRAHDEPDAALAIAALADEQQHLLPLGRGYEAVAQVLLQGGDVLRLQQLGEEAQPALRLWSVRLVAHLQPVAAPGLVLREAAVQEIGAVGHMDAVGLDGQGRGIGHELERREQVRHCLGDAGTQTARDLLKNHPAYLALVLHRAVHREEPPAHAFHRVPPQEVGAEQHLVYLLPVVPGGQPCALGRVFTPVFQSLIPPFSSPAPAGQPPPAPRRRRRSARRADTPRIQAPCRPPQSARQSRRPAFSAQARLSAA